MFKKTKKIDIFKRFVEGIKVKGLIYDRMD